MRNKIANLYNDVLAPVAATQDALVEQLQYMRETDTLSYNKIMDNMKYGRDWNTLKKKKQEEKMKKKQG